MVFDNEARLRKLALPVLNIYGDQDYCIVSAHEKNLGTLNNKFKNVEIKNSAHFPFLLTEHRRQVVAEIKQFIRP